jgi:hypothetical protein
VREALTAVWDSGLRGEPATAEMRINARLAVVTAVLKWAFFTVSPLYAKAERIDPASYASARLMRDLVGRYVVLQAAGVAQKALQYAVHGDRPRRLRCFRCERSAQSRHDFVRTGPVAPRANHILAEMLKNLT